MRDGGSNPVLHDCFNETKVTLDVQKAGHPTVKPKVTGSISVWGTLNFHHSVPHCMQ